MKIIEPRYFALHELLPPDTYYHLEKNNVLWKGWILLPYTTIETIDALRKEFGPMYINSYGLSDAAQRLVGFRTSSGLRTIDFDSRPTYVSPHYAGIATDSIFKNIAAQEVRKRILANPDKFPHIRRLECTLNGNEIGWLHWDSVPVQDHRIYQLHI